MKANHHSVSSTALPTKTLFGSLTSHFALRISQRAPRCAFTLIELMVVIGIISLLIAIVLPSINAARIQARAAASKALIGVLETGVEQFRADQAVGGAYPPSYSICLSPHSANLNNTYDFAGANLLVWALAGADLQGTPGFRDLNGDGVWQSDMHMRFDGTGSPNNGLYAIDPGTGRPAISRSGPFVELSKVKLAERVAGTDPMQFRLPTAQGANTTLYSSCFLDAFEQPVLYYRAEPGLTNHVGRWMSSGTNPGIYNITDNARITGDGTAPGMNLGAGLGHPMSQLGDWTSMPLTAAPQPIGSFAYQLWDSRVYALRRPHRPDSYILLSAGPDALFGTADDIANFPVPK